MGMDRVLRRLSSGSPPLRVSELAEILGCSRSFVHKLIKSKALDTGRLGRDYTIPVQEAERIMREVGVLRD